MSDNIPLEIQVEILKRLPVNSLLRLRSVSKQWKSLIESSDFITGYSPHQTHPDRLLVWYRDLDSYENYVSLIDNNTFTKEEFSPAVPELAKLLDKSRIIGSSHGLLCLYDDYQCHPRHTYGTIVVLWNPSIRKSIGVALPGMFGLETILGFGVCPITSDPTIVKINMWWGMGDEGTSVEVFTLSTGCWRTLTRNLPKSITIRWSQVCVGRFIYWSAYEMVDIDGESSKKEFIMSFDLTTHEFGVVDLPEGLGGQLYIYISVSNVSESLVVDTNSPVRDVWMMDHDVPNSFTKLFTINIADHGPFKTLGFTKSSEPVLQLRYDYGEKQGSSLVVYEPCSGHITYLGIYGDSDLFFVGSYVETLLLLDHSDCSVYGENGVSIYPIGAVDGRLPISVLPKEEQSTPMQEDLLSGRRPPRCFSICSSLRKLCNKS